MAVSCRTLPLCGTPCTPSPVGTMLLPHYHHFPAADTCTASPTHLPTALPRNTRLAVAEVHNDPGLSFPSAHGLDPCPDLVPCDNPRRVTMIRPVSMTHQLHQRQNCYPQPLQIPAERDRMSPSIAYGPSTWELSSRRGREEEEGRKRWRREMIIIIYSKRNKSQLLRPRDHK